MRRIKVCCGMPAFAGMTMKVAIVEKDAWGSR
jgi:hypothetical protein